MKNEERTRPSAPHSCRRLFAGLAVFCLLLLAVVWLVEESVVRRTGPGLAAWLASAAGLELTVTEAGGRFSRGVVLRGVQLTSDNGTHLTIAQVVAAPARPRDWWSSPRRWWGSLGLEGVSGTLVLAPRPAETGARPAHRWRWAGPTWPAVIEISQADVRLDGGAWLATVQGGSLLLDESRTGALQIGEIVVDVGPWQQTFRDLVAVTAWRGGTVYLADLVLGPEATVDALSLELAGRRAVSLEARAFGGYVYADWSGRGQAGTKAALHAFQLGLAEAAAFAGLAEPVQGRLDVAKLTFNGDPAKPWSGQISLRLEADDFVWQDRAFDHLVVGLSVAGRRARLNEGQLRQKANEVALRGTVTLPVQSGGAAWREAPFDFDLAADVRDLRALGALFGDPWSGLSGGLSVTGRASGQAADGQGWLKLRGWGLQGRGLPASAWQADVELEGRDLKLTALDVQSGRDFARGFGRVSLDDTLRYQGRLELRVQEVARYLEPLGRFAPDWARQGGVLLFWDGDGTAAAHSGVATVELVKFTGDLNPVPVNAKLSASYSPGNIYVSSFLLDRGPLSLSSTLYFGARGLSVQGLQLFSGRTRLLNGELFLPLSLEAVLARRPWQETIQPDGGIYAYLRSDDLELESLVQLFGQDAALRGRVDLKLDAQGPWDQAVVDGEVSIAGWQAEWPGLRLPEGQADLSFRLEERVAAVTAAFQPRGGPTWRGQARLPMFGSLPGGGWTLFDHTSPWEAELEVPPTEVAAFAPPAGQVRWTAGTVQADLRAGQTLDQPLLEGSVAWSGGRVEFPAPWRPLAEVNARLVFSGTTGVFEETTAQWGGGLVALQGRADFSDRRNVGWDILLRGERALLYEDERLRWQADIDLTAQGNNEAGAIKGTLGLSGSALLGELMVTPQLGAVSAGAAPVSPLFTLQTLPWASWDLAVEMRSDEFLPAGPDGAGGSVGPNLSLRGTAGEPLLLGTVQVKNIPVAFPSRGSLTVSGAIDFTRAKPWMPVLDLVGSGEAGPYDLQAGAFGPLDERRLFMASAPPLAPEQIVLLLTTDVAPVPVAAVDLAPLTPGEKLQAEPSWLDLDRLRGLLGWGTGPATLVPASEPWSLGSDPMSYEWAWP